MSTLDNMGTKPGTGETFEYLNKGGTDTPSDVTKRRIGPGSQTGMVLKDPSDPESNLMLCQDILDAIQMISEGNQTPVYSRRVNNTFFFKSVGVEGGLTIREANGQIFIGASPTGDIPPLHEYLFTPAAFTAEYFDKFVRVKSDGTGLEFVDINDVVTFTVSFVDSTTTTVHGTGESSTPFYVNVNVSADANNAIEIHSDGLYVAQGASGEDGKSAYEIAVDNGFPGTEQDWLDSLVGPEGPAGQDGQDGAQGPTGGQGAPGAGLLPDEYGDLTEAKIAEIELAGVQWIFLVNPEGDERADQTEPTGLNGDMERHVIMYDPVTGDWKDYGFLTGVAGPPGPQGIQGPPGEKGEKGDPGSGGGSLPVGGLTGDVLTKYSNLDGQASWQKPRYVPNGGTTGQVLAKLTDTSQDLTWITPPSNGLPDGGTLNQILVKTSSIDGQATWQSKYFVPAGGSLHQILRKSSFNDGETEWATISTIPTGGNPGDFLRKSVSAPNNPVWEPIVQVPNGGSTDQVLAKSSSTNGDLKWTTISGIPNGGTTNQVLAKTSNANGAVAWVAPGGLPTGGNAGDVLRKSATAPNDPAWETIIVVPTGGTTGQVLSKSANTDGALTWADPGGLPAGGTTGQALRRNSSGVAVWQNVSEVPTTGTPMQVLVKTASGSDWATRYHVPQGGTTGQVLAKSANTDGSLVWVAPGGLPAGGTTGQVLAKQSATDGDAAWVPAGGLPAGGTTGQVLAKQSATDGDVAWVPAGGLRAFRFRVDFVATAIGAITEVPAGWTITSPAAGQISVTMPEPFVLQNITSHGYQNDPVGAYYKRSPVDQYVRFTTLASPTSFVIFGAVSGQYGANNGQHAYVDIVVR